MCNCYKKQRKETLAGARNKTPARAPGQLEIGSKCVTVAKNKLRVRFYLRKHRGNSAIIQPFWFDLGSAAAESPKPGNNGRELNGSKPLPGVQV